MSIAMKTVMLSNGETLGYREREGGEHILLLVHGNMNSSAHWDLVIEHLHPDFKVFAVDLRGFGVSTYHNPIATLQDFTADLKEFVDLLDLASFSVMGWSTGGGVAMQLAADYPARVKKLLLLASVSTRGYPFYENGADGFPDLGKRIATYEGICALERNAMMWEANRRRDKDFLRAIYNGVIYDRNQPDAPRYEMYLEDMLTQRNLLEVYHALNVFNITDSDYGAGTGNGAVSRIQAPVLMLRGEKDLVITEAMMHELADDLGDRAELVILQECGHSPLVDDLPQLLRHVESFLYKE